MIKSVFTGLTKTARKKTASFSAVLVLGVAGLGGATPLLTQTVSADPTVTVCNTSPGCGQYTTIQDGITNVDVGGTVNVSAGTYVENVNVNKQVSLIGAGSGSTNIVATDANATPLQFSANNATVKGFTITHNYTPAEKAAWNFNNNGVIFNQLRTGNTLEDCTVSLSRNGIYINTAQNNSLINNTITNNRTGINMTGDFTGTTITGNTISDNWTVGLVAYGPFPVNFSTVSVGGNVFDQNWYTQVLVKGPTHATTSAFVGNLDLNGNTFTDTPVTYTTSDSTTWDEPGFAAQQPVALGGSAVKPTTPLPTLRIYGTPAATLTYTPKTLRVGATQPYTTIQSAVADASAGDTIAVDAGTYSGNITPSVNNLTIAGSGSVILNLGSGYGINLNNGPVVTGFKMTGFTVNSSPTTTYALKAYKADGLTLENDTFNGSTGNGGGVDINSTSNVTLNNVTATGFKKNGFAVTAQFVAGDTPSSNITFNGVTATNNNWAGIAFYTMNGSSTTGADITGVTFTGNNVVSGNTKGIEIVGDSDANAAAHNTPRWNVTNGSGGQVDLGTTAFSGNGIDIINYQTNGLQALSATFSGLTGNAMNASQRTSEDGIIVDKLDFSNFGLVKYYSTVVTVNNLSTDDTTPALTGTVNDKDAAVNVTVNGHTYVANVSSTANGSGTYDWNVGVADALPVGTHDVSVAATDIGGNVATDATANELTITAPASSGGGSGGSGSSSGATNGGGSGGGTTTTTGGGRGAGFFANFGFGTGTDAGQVLGATDDDDSKNDSDNENGNVKSASVSKEATTTDSDNAFFGLGLWWIPILAALAALLYFLYRRFRPSEEV